MTSSRRVGLWLVGAHGGVGATTALGMAALSTGQTLPIGLVTALPEFAAVDFDAPAAFVVGGHDVRFTSFARTIAGLHERSNIFAPSVIAATRDVLEEWGQNVKVGIEHRGTDARLRQVATARQALDWIRADLAAFRAHHQLDAVVVVNVASTEPPFELTAVHQSCTALESAFDTEDVHLPASSLYAWAAVAAGCPYVNLTPSLGGTFAAFEEHARHHRVPHAGQDAKTGETLLKSVLAPMFRMRNLKVLSWVGHNILGNNDGRVLNNPANKASKIKTKDGLLAELLGDKPQSHVSIEYIESLDDWKTAWDHVHFEGFLGTKMTLQFTWQGCDSVLAAPLVIDLARIALLAKRRGDAGALPATACFFKSPVGCDVHDLARQFEMLFHYLRPLQTVN
jgi:myo-inositol-1-phosphate synthase